MKRKTIYNTKGLLIGKQLVNQKNTPIEKIFYDYSKEYWIHHSLLVPQFQLITKPHYVIDFALPNWKIAIELDGHKTHKTKEQTTYDLQRQRNLLLHGWFVIRFSGSEIYTNISKCFSEFVDLVEVARFKLFK